MTDLAVRRFGPPGGAPFVFWHALGPDASGAYFEEVGQVLVDRGYDVIAIDGPGFGASPVADPAAYRLEELSHLLWATIEALGLVGRPVLAGHSWGGAVAVTAASQRPGGTQGLVLLDSGHIDYGDLDDVDPQRPLEDWIADVRSRPDPRNAEARAMAMRGLTDPVSISWPSIAAAGIPTLLLLATEPPHVDANRTHVGRFEEAIPHAEIRWVDGAGHGIVQDVGAPLGDEIADWLAAQS